MISLSQTRYGSGASPGGARHGKTRRWRSYHASSFAAEGTQAPEDKPGEAMAQDNKPSMPGTPRHVYGPRPVSALIPALTRATYRRRAPATAQVLADWEAIVGPA